MFGYVRPALNLLPPEERERYRGAYCGLCHAMGERHGFLARFTLNYDFAFLAILFARGEEETRCRRCPAHPLRKGRACACGSGMDAAADASMILTWQKLRDDVLDKGWLKGLPARILCLLFLPAYRRAKRAMPRFANRVEESLEALHKLEAERSGQLDRAADAFACVLMAAAPGTEDETHRRVLEQMLYHVGRWIYLADARDDLEEDRKQGKYNPLLLRYGQDVDDAALEDTMLHSLEMAASALQLGQFGCRMPVLENILYLGLPLVQKAVFNGSWSQIKNQKIWRNDT